jgi:HPt (histidine-containing phosphotransfer) domain-containing protein
LSAAAEDAAAGMSAAMRAGFLRLRAQFVAGLPRRWEEIEQAATPELRRLALHKLCGAAGSYGLAPVSAAARHAEAVCAAVASDENAPAPAASLVAALASLRVALHEAGVTVP